MKNLGLITPCYTADTSGVCSMLYELGGMVIVHDASGCNSTYTTHDEPRWTKIKSMIYISAFTELDAVMGNDEKLIADICAAAADQHPRFIAVCGSPMPMMTGVDFDAIGTEIELRTGIPTLALHTTGTHSYLEGASEALLAYVKRFVSYSSDKITNGVNILGATPLDHTAETVMQSIRGWLGQYGLQQVACFCMGDTPEMLADAGKAAVNLVISQSGIEAAEYMRRQFGIPYLCGVPYGVKYAEQLAQNLHRIINKEPIQTVERGQQYDTVIIGEGIQSVSLADALYTDHGIHCKVICPLPAAKGILTNPDQYLYAEEDIQAEIAADIPKTVIADGLYQPLVPKEIRFINLPHYAFSGRCFENGFMNLINRNIEEQLYD